MPALQLFKLSVVRADFSFKRHVFSSLELSFIRIENILLVAPPSEQSPPGIARLQIDRIKSGPVTEPSRALR
jgi:hypothetical protein